MDNTTWTATADWADPTATGGYRRERLTPTKVNRSQADAAVEVTVAAHIAATGCTPRPAMTFPGKTHVSCQHGAVHATGLKDA